MDTSGYIHWQMTSENTHKGNMTNDKQDFAKLKVDTWQMTSESTQEEQRKYKMAYMQNANSNNKWHWHMKTQVEKKKYDKWHTGFCKILIQVDTW